MKRIMSFLIALILMVCMVSGCSKTEKPVAVDESKAPIVTPFPEENKKLDAETVMLEKTRDYMNSIPANNNMIPAKDGMSLIEDNADAILLVDMRSKEDYDQGHIKGAVNIPFGEIGKNLDRLPINKQIILVCYSGQTSGQAVAAIRLLGFNALSFQGGMNFGWKTLELAEDTLETIENSLPDSKAQNLAEEDKVAWNAVEKYFNEAKNYIEKLEILNYLLNDNPAAIYVLDIRAKEDYDKGHIEGAENIGFKEVGKNLEKLPKNRPIYITCYSGQTAGQILIMLRLNGHNAYSISRGMAGWTGAELPVITP